MGDGIPENTNPFVVILNGCDGAQLHKLAPKYFEFNADLDMPMAKEALGPAVPQAEAERLVRQLVGKDKKAHFAIHERCAHIIPKDLKEVVQILKNRSKRYGQKGFFIPCCDEILCEFLD